MDVAERTRALDARRPRRADAARNFDALVAAGRDAFAEQGSAASLEDIARRAGVGIGTLYRNFPTRDDLIDTLENLLPRDDRYRHAHGSPGHGADHVMPALVAPSVTVPVQGGQPLLGTWQSVVLVDLNRDNPRRSVRLSFING